MTALFRQLVQMYRFPDYATVRTDMTAQFSPKSVRQQGATFPVRRMDFDFKDVNKYFIANDPVSSALWTAFQAYFPEGELFFVDSVRSVRDQVNDPQLQKDVSAFIGQEAMHGKEHATANQALKDRGIDVSRLDQAAGRVRAIGNKRLSKKFRLALTVAAEHFTGVIAEQISRREDFKNSVVDPKIKTLILWHAMEETEHRAVVFDVYQGVGGDYWTRILAFTLVALGISPVVFMGMLVCLSQDRQLFNLASWHLFLTSYWSKQGFFTEMLPEILSFYQPSFHPNRHSPEAVLAQFRQDLAAL